MAAGGRSNIVLTLLAIFIAIALTGTFVVLPYWVSDTLYYSFQEDTARELYQGPHDGQSQPYISAYRLRVIGYVSLSVVIGLIVVGIVAEKRGVAVAGGVALFLPILSHFALSMFFLAGLGLLRTVWIPLLDASYAATGDAGYGAFGLGDLVYLPYIVAVYVMSWVGIDARVALGYIVMGLGLFVFVAGMLAWFTTHLQGRGTADFWLYRLSRHPQYVGWIVWTYGLLLYWIHEGEGTYFKISWSIPDSSPWVVATMVIVGVAMLEEIKMGREQGAVYDPYRERTPFLLPLPRIVTKAVGAPMRLVLRKKRPESGREVAIVIVLYTVLLFVMSYVYGLYAHLLVPYGRLDLLPYADEILKGQV
jgi:protein-S-isoprenylcysteine O-methyltransferase Ste14